MTANFLHAEPNYPADVSYLVADLKYSQEYGLKICEVQHGALSAVQGDLYLSGKDGRIVPMIADFCALFPMKKWAVGMLYPPLERSFKARKWNIRLSTNELFQDPQFLACSAMTPADLFSIGSYAGVVYPACDVLPHVSAYSKAYPGILFMDAATLPYWRDKYRMNALFDENDALKQYKADWRLYPKAYDSSLAERIQKELPSEFYVIKPRGQILANGVIVCENKDLDFVLQMILEPQASLKNHSDKKYSYWWKNKDDTFLIERYYPSDPVSFSPLLGGLEYHYDATMRLAFILQYNEKRMTYHCLGGFWKLPSKALEEEGTLNERKISCCKPPFYMAVEPRLLEEVNAHMEQAMLLLYERMLN